MDKPEPDAYGRIAYRGLIAWPERLEREGLAERIPTSTSRRSRTRALQPHRQSTRRSQLTYAQALASP